MRTHSPPAAVLFVASITFFVFSLSAFLFSFPPPRSAAAQGIATPAVAAGEPLFPLEMHVANNGLTLLRGTRVIVISKTTMTVGTAWGSTNFTWIVHTNGSTYETRNFGTRFLNRNGQEISLQDIRVGDFVTVTGTLDTAAQEPTLDADSVRDLEK